MPTLDELEGLYDAKVKYITSMIKLSNVCLWSSDMDDHSNAAYFGFYSGTSRWGIMSLTYSILRVLPVRAAD